MAQRQFTAIIEREESGYVALCPEIDVASQGSSVEEARDNLIEAIELFLEHASPREVRSRHSIIRQSGLPRALFEVQ
jgi:predicted RNase H-like HicB family nuclease